MRLEEVKTLLTTGAYTCVIVMKEGNFCSKERGIKPLLEALNADMDTSNASVADKVVGKAAAFLYQLMGIKELYADTISQAALKVLHRAEIYVEYRMVVPYIKNRDNTGPCPMESAVWEIEDAHLAKEILENKRKELSR